MGKQQNRKRTATEAGSTACGVTSPSVPIVDRMIGVARRALHAMVTRLNAPRREREMRLCETLALGDKRLLALVQVGHERFLIGGAPNSVVLLATLKRTGARTEEASAFPRELATAVQKMRPA